MGDKLESSNSCMWGTTAMSFLKSILGSCPLAYFMFSVISAIGGAFIPLLVSLHTLLSDHFEVGHLPQTAYLTAIVAGTLVSSIICVISAEKYRDYICFLAITMVPPAYAFSLYSILINKTCYITYIVSIGIGGMLFGVISTTVISSASSINPISTTAYVFGIQLANLVCSIVYHYISYNPEDYDDSKRSEILFKMHSFPVLFGLVFSIIFIIYVKSSVIADVKDKNGRVDDGSNSNSLFDVIKDMMNTYVASGLVAFSILIESIFIPSIIPYELKLPEDEILSTIILNAFYAALGALISGIVPLSDKSFAFKFILWPINLLRIPALLIAAQTNFFEVTPLYISSAITFSGMLHGYSVGSSFACISGTTKGNKSQAYEFNTFIYIFFMAIGNACSTIYVQLSK